MAMNQFLGKEMRGYYQDYRRKVYGTTKQLAAWKFCLHATSGGLKLPLSKLFVDEKFDEKQMKDVSKNSVSK